MRWKGCEPQQIYIERSLLKRERKSERERETERERDRKREIERDREREERETETERERESKIYNNDFLMTFMTYENHDQNIFFFSILETNTLDL